MSETSLSIVVICISDAATRARCLHEIAGQAREHPGVEVLALGAPGDENLPAGVRRLPADEGCSVPEMRWSGIQHSRGELVALLEDDGLPEPGWLKTILSFKDEDFTGLAGAILPDNYPLALDWAVFFCDYGRFLHPPGPETPPAGNHVIYRRSRLLAEVAAIEADMQFGLYDALLHPALAAAGSDFYPLQGTRLRIIHRWSMRDVTGTPFRRGRDFACRRRRAMSRRQQMLRGAGSVLLPLFLTVRTIRTILPHANYRRKLAAAFFWILLFHSAWSAGECMGYVLKCDTMAWNWTTA